MRSSHRFSAGQLSRSTFPARVAVTSAAAAALLLLGGCGSSDVAVLTPVAMNGQLIGGQQPVAGSTIQLYTVGTTANGSAATPLLTSTVTTDASGRFHISGLYSCSSATQVYITATGGQPLTGQTNSNLALMTALGACTSLSSSTFITINELTTAAATFSLAGFITGPANVGASTDNAALLAQAMTTAQELVDPSTGAVPGSALPAGDTVNVPLVNTLGDIMAACINSSGGTANDGSACGTLFSLTPNVDGVAPTDTITAFANMALRPRNNTTQLYNLAAPSSPFQPMLSSAPADFTPTVQAPNMITVTPNALVFPSTGVGSTASPLTLYLSNNTSAAISEAVIVSGTNSSDFGFTATNCSIPLAAGASCTYTVTFSPTGAGQRLATITIRSGSDPSSPTQTIPLEGTGH